MTPQEQTRLPPPQWRPTNAEYHTLDGRWSSTMLGDFRRSPALAWGRYEMRTLERPRPTESMVVGSVVNHILVDPEDDLVVVDIKGRDTKTFQQAVRDHPEALVVTQPEYGAGCRVAEAVLGSKTKAGELARRLLIESPGFSEYALCWEDSTGVPCKLKIDRLTTVGNEPAIVELKTTRDPSPTGFNKSFLNFGYENQVAFYRRGMEVALGTHVPLVFVVAVHNQPPYEVATYQVSPEYLELGKEQVERDLTSLAVCLAGGPWCSAWEDPPSSVPVLEPPPWARRRREDTLIDQF